MNNLPSFRILIASLNVRMRHSAKWPYYPHVPTLQEYEEEKKMEITRQQKVKRWKKLIQPDIPDYNENQPLPDIQRDRKVADD